MSSPRNNQTAARILREMIAFAVESRKVLSERLGVSKAWTSRQIDALIHRGWVDEGPTVGGNSRGRRTTLLVVRADLGYLLGADLEGSAMRVCLLDAARQVVASSRQAVDVPSQRGRIGEQWIELIRQVIRTSGIEPKRIVGLGVGLPGTVQPGLARTRAYLPPGQWLELDLGKKMAEFGLPVTAANNALCVAEYERRLGLARQGGSFIAVLVRYGIGAALGSEHGFYADDDIHAGELGHMRIDLRGPKCICGHNGCVDVFCSGRTWPPPMQQRGKRWQNQLRSSSRYLGLAIGNLLKQVGAQAVILNGIYNEHRPTVEPELVAAIAAELDGLGLPTPKVEFGQPVEFKASIGAALRAADQFLGEYLGHRMSEGAAVQKKGRRAK